MSANMPQLPVRGNKDHRNCVQTLLKALPREESLQVVEGIATLSIQDNQTRLPAGHRYQEQAR